MKTLRLALRGALAAIIGLLMLEAPTATGSTLLPQPESLAPNVRFWTRIYSEIDGQSGLIHDSRHMDVVYEVVRFPSGLSRRGRERQVERAKADIRAALKRLGAGKRSGLSRRESRILALWPEGVSNATLRTASRSIRFQLGQADRFRQGLIREGAWREYIRHVFSERGLPPQLTSLPHVESSYNPKAYSRVGAAGLWQFTRSTGRLFLRVDHVVDERMDPFKSTVAAAQLLEANYRELGSWPLAITAYNHGQGGMRRAVRTLGTDDIGVIVQRYQGRTFGFASRNFYAEFLAAAEVDANAERYFGPLQTNPPATFDTVEMEHFYPASAVSAALGIDEDTLREFNPALRPSVWNGAKYVPRGFALQVPPGSLRAPGSELLASVPASQRMARQHIDTFYTVRRGDTLSRIARRYRVKERELMALNNLRSRHRIRAGQVLRLPDRLGGVAPTHVARAEPPENGVYRVRRGDTVSTIAARFGLSESQLVSWNGLRNRNRIAVGQRLSVQAPDAPLQQLAEVARAPKAKAETPAAAEVASEPVAEVAALEDPATPADAVYGVSGNRIRVQADETLGHYAEWLELKASTLRRLNGMGYETPVVIGRRLKLDFRRVSPETFVNRRLEYHRTLQEEFFGAYQVTGTDTHVLRSGDSLWYLANQKYDVPVWLLRQYNPELDLGSLAPGQRMVIPRVEPRSG